MLPNYCQRKTVILTIVNGSLFKVILLSLIQSDYTVKLEGVILEAPFLNASQAGKDYFLSSPFNNNKWIQNKTDEALKAEKISFNNDKRLNIKLNIFRSQEMKLIILHISKAFWRSIRRY